MTDDAPTPIQTETRNAPRADAPSNGPERQRPKLNLSGLTDTAASRKGPTGERRKGKSIFGVVLGTLNRAKIEDKQRMSSEAVRLVNLLPIRKILTNSYCCAGKEETRNRRSTAGQTCSRTEHRAEARRISKRPDCGQTKARRFIHKG